MEPCEPDFTAGSRAAASFACAFVGWGAGIGWYVGACVLVGFGHVTDFEAIATWSALLVALVWLVVMLPLALRVSREGALARATIAPLFGAIAGFACFTAVLLPLGAGALAGMPVFAVHAALVSACALGLFALALRRRGRRSRD